MHTSITAQFFAQLILTIVAIAPSQTTETAELRLMTYNVHHCEGVDATKLTPTIPVSKPTLKIDYIFFQHDSPWMVVSSQVLNEPIASDHLPLVATLRKKAL